MNFRLTRRRFGQIIIAGGVVVVAGSVVGRGFAQTSGKIFIIGVKSGQPTNTDSSIQVDSLDNGAETEAAVSEEESSSTKTIVVEAYNVESGEVTTETKTESVLESGEQIRGAAVDKKGLVISTNPIADQKQKPKRLISIDKKRNVKTKKVSGLSSDEALDLTQAEDGSVTGVVNNERSSAKPTLVNVESESGNVEKKPSSDQIASTEEFRIIAKCADGTSYGITTGSQGETSLVGVETGKAIQLTFEGSVWNSGFIDLVCTPTGELYAVGAKRYEYPNYLHKLNKQTGEITRLVPFNVAAITVEQR